MEVDAIVVILIAIVYLAIAWFIAKWFYEAAEAKGWHDKKYFWICFLLSTVGYLLVIALPDRGCNVRSAVSEDSLPEL